VTKWANFRIVFIDRKMCQKELGSIIIFNTKTPVYSRTQTYNLYKNKQLAHVYIYFRRYYYYNCDLRKKKYLLIIIVII